MTAEKKSTTAHTCSEKIVSFFSNGVSHSFSSANRFTIVHICVCSQVATTIPAHVHLVAEVPENAILFLSERFVDSSSTCSAIFSTGTLSQVSIDSFISTACVSINLISATNLSPAAKIIRSHGTNSFAGSIIATPPLITVVFCDADLESFSIAFSALNSW
jgi:hypothetical protein